MGAVCREWEITEGATWRIPEAGWAVGWGHCTACGLATLCFLEQRLSTGAGGTSGDTT